MFLRKLRLRVVKWLTCSHKTWNEVSWYEGNCELKLSCYFCWCILSKYGDFSPQASRHAITSAAVNTSCASSNVIHFWHFPEIKSDPLLRTSCHLMFFLGILLTLCSIFRNSVSPRNPIYVCWWVYPWGETYQTAPYFRCLAWFWILQNFWPTGYQWVFTWLFAWVQ